MVTARNHVTEHIDIWIMYRQFVYYMNYTELRGMVIMNDEYDIDGTFRV
jgi:hypothetical protein